MDTNISLHLIIITLVRIGIPIGITWLIVHFLRRLDAKWQNEVEVKSVSSQPAMYIALKDNCWLLRKCQIERRDHCPAFSKPDIPCWDLFRSERDLDKKCLDCEVLLQSMRFVSPMNQNLLV